MIAPPCFGPTIDNGLVACVSCRKGVLHRQMIMQTTRARRFQHRDHANLLAKPLGCVAKRLLVQSIEEVPQVLCRLDPIKCGWPVLLLHRQRHGKIILAGMIDQEVPKRDAKVGLQVLKSTITRDCRYLWLLSVWVICCPFQNVGQPMRILIFL